MIRLGEKQRLEVTKRTDFGIYLADTSTDKEDAILLPNKEIPENTEIGDTLEVFVYKDSSDRFICTTHEPLIHLGEIKELKVAQLTKIGAFLEWGLLKELFLPFKEQVGTLKEEQMCLVGLYIDKSERLCATMHLSKILSTDSPYVGDEKTKGVIFSINKEMGLFVAVDGRYQGLIPVKEVTRVYKVGEEIEVRIVSVRSDGKLELSIKESGGFAQMEVDEQILYDALVNNDGFLPIHDKTDKDEINKVLGMSKRAYKRAFGRLMKSGKALQNDEGTYLKIQE